MGEHVFNAITEASPCLLSVECSWHRIFGVARKQVMAIGSTPKTQLRVSMVGGDVLLLGMVLEIS